MKKTYLLTLLIANSFALSTNINVGTLGVGANLTQDIGQNWGIDAGIHYIGIDNLKIGSASGNFAGITANYDNSLSINNTAFNLGIYYNFVNNEFAKVGVEGGLLYNNYNYSQTQAIQANAFGQHMSMDLTSNSFEMNRIAPYSQINTQLNITQHFSINSSLGVEKTDLKLVGPTTNNSYLSINYMPILQIGFAYNF